MFCTTKTRNKHSVIILYKTIIEAQEKRHKEASMSNYSANLNIKHQMVN